MNHPQEISFGSSTVAQAFAICEIIS